MSDEETPRAHPRMKSPRAAAPWKKGQSGNPAGVSHRARMLRAAIHAAEGPEEVAAVVAAMRAGALAGDAHCAKVYLDRVVGPVKDLDIDLTDAPDDVVRWLAENLTN